MSGSSSKSRAESETGDFQFDFAISYAGEDRHFAKELADKLNGKGVTVFYDSNYKSRLLGKKLGQEFRTVFGHATRFFVPLISKHYVEKDYTNYEWTIAKEEQKRRTYEFILPMRLDDTPLVGLHMDVGFLDLRTETLDVVVGIMIEKLQSAGPAVIEYVGIAWVATFGLAIKELLEGWNLPDSAPRTYSDLCDWLQQDLERRLLQGPVSEFVLTEDSRSGETLSLRYAFIWSPRDGPLDFGSLDWWEVLEVLPWGNIYPGEEFPLPADPNG